VRDVVLLLDFEDWDCGWVVDGTWICLGSSSKPGILRSHRRSGIYHDLIRR
jgi:hypothetical protein